MEFVGDLAASAASLTISFHPAWWVRRPPAISPESGGREILALKALLAR